MTTPRIIGSRHNTRDIFPPTGTTLTAKSWLTEAPLRMLMNNLHPDVAENPHELVVYGGIGRAARTWEDFDAIVAALTDLNADETLLVQSGKPVGVFRTHENAPRVLIANSNLVPHWATWDGGRAAAGGCDGGGLLSGRGMRRDARRFPTAYPLCR